MTDKEKTDPYRTHVAIAITAWGSAIGMIGAGILFFIHNWQSITQSQRSIVSVTYWLVGAAVLFIVRNEKRPDWSMSMCAVMAYSFLALYGLVWGTLSEVLMALTPDEKFQGINTIAYGTGAGFYVMSAVACTYGFIVRVNTQTFSETRPTLEQQEGQHGDDDGQE